MLTISEAQPDMPPEARQKLPVLSILKMLWNRRWVVLTLWLCGSALSIAIVRTLPSVYQAEAVVLVDTQKIPETFVSPTVNGDVADRLDLLTQSIMTSTRLLDVIATFHLYQNERLKLTQEELLQRMREDISVQFEKNWTGGRTRSFRLTYRGPDPKVVAAVTNRLAALYVEENLHAREHQAEGTVAFLKHQLEEAKKGLDDQEKKVARFKEEHNGTLPEQETSLLGTLSSLSLQLQGIQEAIARNQENKLSLQAALSAAQSSEVALRASLLRQSAGSGQESADPRMLLKPKSEMLAEQLRQLRLRYSSEHPDVQALARQLAEAKREEADENSSATSDPSNSASRANETMKASQMPKLVTPELLQINERITSLKGQITVASHQADSLEGERKQVITNISECQARINKLPLVEQQMVALKRNYEESANNYNSLLQKQLAAGVATDMERSQQSERFTIIDAARIPEKPIKPKRPLFAVLGSVGGLVIGLLCAFLLEFRKHKLLGEWELPQGTVVLGRVPPIRITDPSAAAER